MRRPILSDRQGFDRRWYAPNVSAVYTPSGLGDVQGTVQDALAKHGDGVKVVSGRHCYEDFVYGNGTRAVIDMSGMNQVGHDDDRGYFADAGAENWTVYRTLLNRFDRTLPAGSCYSVGAGGHITGGGYGLLSRFRGLTVDHLTGVDIVTWDAKAARATLRYVSAESSDPREQDLFWALRGAGCGNFGVIARYYFRELPKAPERAAVMVLAWDWAEMTSASFRELLTTFGKWIPVMPEQGFAALKLNHKVEQGQIGLVYQYASQEGSSADEHREQAAAALADAKERFADVGPLRELRRPLGGHPGLMTTHAPEITQLTYLEALQTMGGSAAGQYGKYKSAYMRKGFPDDQIAAIYEHLQKVPHEFKHLPTEMAQSLLQVDSYGGQINTVSPTHTPVPQRDSILKLQYQTYWTNDSPPGHPDAAAKTQEAAHLRWIREFYEAVYRQTGGTPNPARDPTGTVDGCYFNYPDVDLGSNEKGTAEAALALYFGRNLRTEKRNLVAVKRAWDPTQVFRHAQSLPVS